MNRLQLFLELRRHRRLADRRSLDFTRNKVAKWLVYIISAIMIIYLMGFAVMFSLIVNEDRTTDSVSFIFTVAPFLLTLDFFLRFIAQQTPAQLVKPYMLLPIHKYACIDAFLLNSILSLGNLIWMFFLIPYVLMSVVFTHGVLIALGVLLLFWLLITANSQWYLLVRTLINDKLYYWFLPIAFYLLLYSPLLIELLTDTEPIKFSAPYDIAADSMLKGHCWPLLAASLLLAVLVAVNRRVQHFFVMKELFHTTTTHLSHVSTLGYLDRFGEIGQYLKLEVKSIMRNKNPRIGFTFSSCIVILMSVCITLTDVYDSQFMTNFWCFYNYVIFGSMLILKIMSYEGNYIDCLMIRRENILHMLQAKYYFYSALLLLPFLLMMPTVFSSKWPLLMVISYGFFTAGFQYFLLFQLAVYNRRTLPLNTKITGTNGMENNYYQMGIQMLAFIIPISLVSLLETCFNNTTAYLIMMFIGIGFIATHHLWMRHIYQRMMRRKYDMLEGLHSTR